MPKNIRVRNNAHLRVRDIDPSAHIDARHLDAIVRQCVAAATEALKSPSSQHTHDGRAFLSLFVGSMNHTHDAIRALLAAAFEKASSVDVLALARVQVEAVYAVCLMVESEEFVDLYVKNHWKDLFTRYLLDREERANLPRFREYLETQAPRDLRLLANLSRVSPEEIATIESEELGVPLKVKPHVIPPFPSPLRAISRIQDQSRKAALSRLYFEYKHLCQFSHGFGQSASTKAVLDGRSPYSRLFAPSKIHEMFDKNFAMPAIVYSLLGVTLCSTEIATMCPDALDLRVTLSKAWKTCADAHLLGQVLWDLRGQPALGVLAIPGPADQPRKA